MMKDEIEIYESKDKNTVPFLLIQAEAEFLGTRVECGVVYFQFLPKELCERLVNAYLSGKAKEVQAKDLLNAVETYKNIVFQKRGEGY
ncbi:MAG: hypothetical protein V1487_02690 [bacterium]